MKTSYEFAQGTIEYDSDFSWSYTLKIGDALPIQLTKAELYDVGRACFDAINHVANEERKAQQEELKRKIHEECERKRREAEASNASNWRCVACYNEDEPANLLTCNDMHRQADGTDTYHMPHPVHQRCLRRHFDTHKRVEVKR